MYGIRRDAGAVRTVLVFAAGIVLVLWLGERIHSALRAALTALVIAYLSEPAVSLFEKKMPRALAAFAVFLIGIVLAASVCMAVLIPAVLQFSELPGYISAASKRMEGVFGAARGFLDGYNIGIPSGNAPFGTDANAAQIVSKLFSFLISGVGSVASVISSGMAVFALSYFFLLDWKNLSVRIQLFVPSRIRAKAVKAALCVRRDLGGYLRGQSIIILIVSLITVGALYLLKSPLPLAMGLLYGLMNAIPYFGPLIGVIPPVASALALGWQQAILTLGTLLLIQQIDNYAVSPRVMGAVAGASPAMVLFAITVGSSLFGVAGMFLALPVLVTAKAVFRVFAAGDTGT